jgi:DNA-directed RNA polymerase specialized sigma24 family protein
MQTITDCADPLIPSVEETAEERETCSNLAAIIDSLKEPYKAIAYAYYIQNIPLAQYAAAHNIPLKTLQTRIAGSAKEMIRKKYGEEYNDATV